MLRTWAETEPADGSAAYETARLAANHPIIDGAVIPASIKSIVLAEREEQLSSLVDVVDAENIERVVAELRKVILTVHVPRSVQADVEAILKDMAKPVLARLSPSGAVANPLAPTMIIGLLEGKLFLDAIRMLYAELYTAQNLLATEDRRGAIIVQHMPDVNTTYRILRSDSFTIVEGTRGLGCWVGYGEPDRFLFENGVFARSEHGDEKGVAWDVHAPKQFTRQPLGGEDAQRLLAWAQPYLATAPANSQLLFCATDNGFFCLGAGPSIASKRDTEKPL
jgi:hypothetical protein